MRILRTSGAREWVRALVLVSLSCAVSPSCGDGEAADGGDSSVDLDSAGADAGATDSAARAHDSAVLDTGSADTSPGVMDSAASDSGTDSGTSDAGTADDATADDATADDADTVDAGSVLDASTADDAGMADDAGPADAGSVLDAGTADDAGPADAGSVADAATDGGWSSARSCVVEDARTDPALSSVLGALEIRLGPDVRTLSVDELLAATDVPAISIAVRRPGEPIFAAAYGTSLSSVPLSTDTVFQAGSISKAVWSMALLSQDDTASWLDTDVRDVLGELPASHRVTPADLLTHTSGATVSGFLGYPPDVPLPTKREIVLGLPPANSPSVTFGPAGTYSYSGGGFVTLQWWFQTAMATSLESFASGALFASAGLGRSTYAQPLPAAETDHACARDTRLGTACSFVYPEQSAAGLWTTPSDLACLSTYLSEARPDVLERARSRAVPIPGWPQSMGLGIRHRVEGAAHLFEHGGINVGYCDWWLFFDDGRALAVMSSACTAYSLQVQIVWNLCRALGWPCTRPGFQP